jgi:hypothetical protein
VKPARALVMKPKPLMMFMNMLFQKSVIPRPTEATPEGKGFVPRHFEEDSDTEVTAALIRQRRRPPRPHPDATRKALERAYRDLGRGEAVCRPRIDIRIPTRDPERVYQWGTMEGGSTGGYFAIRIKSDILFERETTAFARRRSTCSRPGRYCGLVLLTRDRGRRAGRDHP